MRLILFLLFFSTCFSQNEKSIRIEYNETISYIPKIVKKNLTTLYVSKDYSYYNLKSSKVETKDTDDDSETIIVNTKDTKDFSEIIINNNEKTLTERLYEKIFLKKYYAVKENLQVMKWKIFDEERKIKNYLCKKAQITFRGRTFTAWYTEKIPISSGPWKFNGLPGLILSVKDNSGIYKWEVKTITYPFKGNEIDFKKIIIDNPKFKNISYKDFDKKRCEAIQDKIETIKSRNSNREGMYAGYSYSTSQEKEPINEWRKKTEFE